MNKEMNPLGSQTMLDIIDNSEQMKTAASLPEARKIKSCAQSHRARRGQSRNMNHTDGTLQAALYAVLPAQPYSPPGFI